jgi:hypothetical protein
MPTSSRLLASLSPSLIAFHRLSNASFYFTLVDAFLSNLTSWKFATEKYVADRAAA